MHRRHTRRKVLAIYLRAQAGVLRRRVHSAISRFVTQPRIRALVIDGLRMKPRMRGTEIVAEEIEVTRWPENIFRPSHEEHGALEDVLLSRFGPADPEQKALDCVPGQDWMAGELNLTSVARSGAGKR